MAKGLGALVGKGLKATDSSSAALFQKEFERLVIAAHVAGESGGSRRKAWKPSMFGKCERYVYYYFVDAPRDLSGSSAKGAYALKGGSAHHLIAQSALLHSMKMDSEIQLIDMTKRALPEGTELSDRENPIIKAIHGILKDTPEEKVKELITFLQSRELLTPEDTEWKFYNSKYNISGMIDGALHFLGKDKLWEYKTIKPDDFKNLVEPKSEHKEQGVLYYICLGISTVIFHYEDKGNHAFKVFEHTYTDAQVTWALNKIDNINQAVASRIPPAKTVEQAKCRFCEYKSICEKNQA